VLTIAIAVELKNIAIGIIAESFGIVIGSARIRLAPITLERTRGSPKCMLPGIEQAVELIVQIRVAGGGIVVEHF
jgi:hypothetical protein